MIVKDPYKIAHMINPVKTYNFCFYDFNGRPIDKIKTKLSIAYRYMTDNYFAYDLEFYRVGPPHGDIDIFCYKKKKIDIDDLLNAGKSFKDINKIMLEVQ